MAELAGLIAPGLPLSLVPPLVGGAYALVDVLVVDLIPDPDDVTASAQLLGNGGATAADSVSWAPGPPLEDVVYLFWRFSWDLTDGPEVGDGGVVQIGFEADGFDLWQGGIYLPNQPAVPLYGVTVGDVRNHLAHRTFSPGSKPTAGDVVQLLARVSSSLAARIGDVDVITDDGRRARIRSAARHAVALGAAAYTEAAAAPELANPNDASSYAQWLWARYQEAWAEVVGLVDAITPGDEPAGATPVLTDGPAIIGGERFGWSGRGW